MKLGNIFDRIIDVFAVIAAVLIGLLMLGTGADVLARYFFNRPIEGMIEIAQYELLLITFFTATWVLRREGHVKMDLVLNRFKPGTQAIVDGITHLLGAIACLTITWYGTLIVLDHFQIGYRLGSGLRPFSWPLMAVIPLGSLLLSIQFLRMSYGYLARRKASH